MTTLRIAGGRVVDPANGVDDEVRDLWITDGRVVEAPTDPGAKPDRTLDARGFVVMPGGVDVHCHIAGSKVNAARMLRPEDQRSKGVPRHNGLRSGSLGSVPSTFTTGYRYAGLGYTTAVDAAIPPLGARHAHHELRDTPIIDKAILILMGNNHAVMDRIREGEHARLRDYVAWLLNTTRGYGVKVVNPGGVENWKEGHGNVTSLDQVVPHFEVTPRQILVELARVVDELGIPHPMHLHTPNLGLPGNWTTTLETMKALDGHRAHMAHIQFHSYGGSLDDTRAFDSQVPALADYINTHPGISVDVGQVLFGDTTSMTADGAVGQFLHSVTGRKWLSHDVEMETGCGVVPITYENKNFVHALQWAIGLEWYLRVDDPWRVAMSTDHPNGGSFLAYPQIIALLMDRGHRADMLASLPDRVRARSGLGDLSREYTLSEIAIITRAAPARMLGLAQKGHLGPGADGDVAIYAPDDDKERMFSLPRYLIKHGEIVLDDGDLRHAPSGEVRFSQPGFDPEAVAEIEEWFSRDYSIQFANFPVSDDDLEGATS
ncbi:formylmethanofuran dehydrogenase subunit A [Singulisphaera acidiphila]|uniref:Formylmethanofuran dehydrogenase subunit A n=1 Tax=Singulisphaera acidiphila (strain ATCC BAA-1392 / DSM 18658 / VKM B-2454 / MOB10) TaxID=886293 RepID=L0D894_SINAD|nr:formylmethanofuran dehydrogenase subunit A [Singulisphaera acidiphila]AGA25629.1 formylmethanofuran dehydrogenase subunit A [Singulisphaera acidiphila DSM 18658]